MRIKLIKEGAIFTLYSIEQGESAFDLLNDLMADNPKAFSQIIARLNSLADDGFSFGSRKFNSLGNGLFEAKASLGPRVIYFHDGNRIIICTNGFGKDSNKTRKRHLQLAEQRKKQYVAAKKLGDFQYDYNGQPEPKRKP